MSHVPSDLSTAQQHTGDRLHYQLCCILCHNHHGTLHAMDISARMLITDWQAPSHYYSFTSEFFFVTYESLCIFMCVGTCVPQFTCVCSGENLSCWFLPSA